MPILLGCASTPVVIAMIINHHDMKIAYQNGCMDGVVHSYLAINGNPKFNPDKIVQDFCLRDNKGH